MKQHIENSNQNGGFNNRLKINFGNSNETNCLLHLTPEILKDLNQLLFELDCLNRWSSHITKGLYNELGKLALNCSIAYIWATFAVESGFEVDFSRFPKLAIYRAYQKSVHCDIAELRLDEICKYGVSREQIEEHSKFTIKTRTNEEFANFVDVDTNCIEYRIYKAATCVGTLTELLSLRKTIEDDDFLRTKGEILESLHPYRDLPHFCEMLSDTYMKIFNSFSKLRSRIRWAMRPNIIKSSVLSHSFDTAVFAYMMSLENNPSDIAIATQAFFAGIFHDFPETWTGDMPSPIKNAITGLRKATEDYELEVLEKNFYSKLPEYQIQAIKLVMLEELEFSDLKHLIKQADYFSADVECWRHIIAGTNCSYYFNVIFRDYEQKYKFNSCFAHMMDFINGDAIRYSR